METEECEISDLLEFGKKLQDKLLELQAIRTAIKDLDNQLKKSQLEMRNYQEIAEKTKREMKEITSAKIEAVVAEARDCEADQMANKELLSVQTAQLRINLAEMDILLQQIRTLEVENAELEQSLKRSEEKETDEGLLREKFKIKESQWNKKLEHLASETKSAKEYHEKLINVSAAILQTCPNKIEQFKSKTDQIAKLESAKVKLQDQVSSLSHARLISNLFVEEPVEKENISETEVENALQDMENANRDKEKEINALQNALDNTMKLIKSFQERNKSLEDEIITLESEESRVAENERTAGSQGSDEKLPPK